MNIAAFTIVSKDKSSDFMLVSDQDAQKFIKTANCGSRVFASKSSQKRTTGIVAKVGWISFVKVKIAKDDTSIVQWNNLAVPILSNRYKRGRHKKATKIRQYVFVTVFRKLSQDLASLNISEDFSKQRGCPFMFCSASESQNFWTSCRLFITRS